MIDLAPPIVLTVAGQRLLALRLARAAQLLRSAQEPSNADRDVSLEEIARLQTQVAEIRHVLSVCEAPTNVPDDPRIVEVGDEVLIEFDDGDLARYVLVHPIEAAMQEDAVSVASPLGVALVGQRIGDQVVVTAPDRRYTCTVRSRSRAR